MSVFKITKMPPLVRPWYVKFMHDTKIHRGGGFETREEAEKYERDLRDSLGRKKSPEEKFCQEMAETLKTVYGSFVGTDKAGESPAMVHGVPLGKIVSEFLDYKKDRVSRTQFRKKRNRLMRFRDWFDIPIPDGLEPVMIDKHMEKRLRVLSADDANRDRAILGEVIRWAMPRYKIAYNPVDATEPYTHERKKSMVPSEEDVKKVREAIPKVAPSYWKAFMTVVEETCCRPISAVRLTWEDVMFRHPNPEWHNGGIKLKDYKGGKGEARYTEVPMSARLANTLKAIRNGQPHGELVFPSPYTGKELQNWKGVLKKACSEADVEYFTFGQLRPHGATVLAFLGVPVETIQHLLGHSKVTTTQGYVRRHGYEDSMARAVELRERRKRGHLKDVSKKVA